MIFTTNNKVKTNLIDSLEANKSVSSYNVFDIHTYNKVMDIMILQLSRHANTKAESVIIILLLSTLL